MKSNKNVGAGGTPARLNQPAVNLQTDEHNVRLAQGRRSSLQNLTEEDSVHCEEDHDSMSSGYDSLRWGGGDGVIIKPSRW